MRISKAALLLTALAALVLAATAAGAPTAAKAPQLKVALVAPSAHNDLAFTQSMYAALQSLKAKYNLKIAVSENQFVVADAANIIHQYAQQGYDLVIAHGSQYGSTVQQLASQFPKTSFAWGTAGATFGKPNVYAYQAASQEGGFVQGYVGALLSKSKVLGVIGPIAVGDAKLYVDGFVAGAKSAVKGIEVNVAYTGSFSDPSLMSKQATQFLAQKADALTGSSQSVVGAITVAKAQNVPWFGTQWLQTTLAPKQVVSSQVYNWKPILTTMLTDIQHGKLGGRTFTIGLANGGEKIAFNPAYPLPASIKAAANKVIAGISKKTIKVGVGGE